MVSKTSDSSMGKFCNLLTLTSVMVAILAAYCLYEPIPTYLKDSLGLRLFLVKTKALLFLGNVLYRPAGYSSIDISRMVYSYNLGDQSYLEDYEEDIKTVDIVIDGVSVRIYKPRDRMGLIPGLVYIHGGRWSLMDLDDYDDVVAHQVLKAHVIAVSVGYRLAPEHPFPAGFEDCLTVAKHVLYNGIKYGIDTSRVAIAGDDAGGNMAAAVAIHLRDAKVDPPLKMAVLIYPSLSFCSFHGPSYQHVLHVEGHNASAEAYAVAVAQWLNFTAGQLAVLRAQCFTAEFLSKCRKLASPRLLCPTLVHSTYRRVDHPECEVTRDVEHVSRLLMDPRVSPAMVDDVKGLPQTFILTTEFDIVRDDGAIFAKRLKLAGVPFRWLHLDDSFHWIFNFFYGNRRYYNGKQIHRIIGEYIRKYV